MNRDKEVLQKWIEDLGFSHFITIEPTPYLPFKIDEIRQRLRIVEFKLNKKYLLNSFTKWKDEDKFYFIVFPEGDGLNKHYHILLHTPQKVMKKKFYYEKVFEFDLSSYWGLVPSKNPTTQKFRKFEELLDIFDVEKIKSPTGSSRYASKKYNAWFERLGLVDEDKRYFFPTPSKSQKLKSMRVQ